MQIIYKFRVSFEEHDDVVRFIDIDSTSNFFDLHKIIQESVGFDASKQYEFFISNDIWRSEGKICSTSVEGEKDPAKTNINKFINSPNQKFVYVFDPELDWVFYIELIKIQKAEYGKKYPIIARKEGEAPKQYKLKGKEPGAVAKNEYDKMAEMLIASRMLENIEKVPLEGIEEEEIEIDDEEIVLDESAFEITEEEPEKKSEIKPIISSSLKFDDEDLKIDTDDLDFLEEEKEETDEESEDDEFGNDYNNSGNYDDNYDDY